MPWIYKQSSGRLSLNTKIIGTGYSGKGDGKNNPKMESVSNVGPIPKGRYKIGKARLHPTKGPVTMTLTPIGHNALKRTHFLIHGDSSAHPGEASEGCIILNRLIRRKISTSDDDIIEVI